MIEVKFLKINFELRNLINNIEELVKCGSLSDDEMKLILNYVEAKVNNLYFLHAKMSREDIV